MSVILIYPMKWVFQDSDIEDMDILINENNIYIVLSYHHPA